MSVIATAIAKIKAIPAAVKDGVLNRIVADWRVTLRTYSVWILAAFTVSPEIFDAYQSLVTALGFDATTTILPKAFTDMIRAMGAIGLVLRFVRQSKQSIAEAAKQIAADRAAEAANAQAKDGPADEPTA